MRHLFVYIIIIFSVHHGYAQSGFIKKAQKRLEKGEFDKVEELINRSFEKDSLYPAGFFMKSVLFFTSDYPGYQIDSAYRYILTTTDVYDSLDEKEKGRHAKLGVDLLSIDSLKRTIDNAAFVRSTDSDQEEDYIFFLKNFPTAIQVDMAIGLRNERAFQTAVRSNTYQSYKTFMMKYPEARQLKEAERRYEKLYYDKSTADDKLKSYQQFLQAHPTTPYRKEAEVRIFQILTAGHSLNGYLSFIKTYPNSHLIRKAVDLMFHVGIDSKQFEDIPEQYLTDSLRNASFDKGDFLIPFLKNKRFGFINQKGDLIQDADYSSIDELQICGAIENDFYVADNKLWGINGDLIYGSPFEEVHDLGFGILKVKAGDKVGVIHKSGFEILEAKYQDAKLIQGKFLAVRTLGKWDLYSIAGVPIVETGFDNIFSEGHFILFEKNREYDLKRAEQLSAVVNRNPLSFKMIFEDYELIDDSVMWLQSSYGEVIYDLDFNELIPYDEHEISFQSDIYTSLKDDHFKVYDSLFQVIGDFKFDVLYRNEKWSAYRKDTLWSLVDMESLKVETTNYDSLRLLGDHFAVGHLDQSIEILTRDKKITIDKDQSKFSLISELQSSQYLLFSSSNDRKPPSVYDENGKKIFQAKFESLSPIRDYGLVFQQKGKKGIISPTGEYLLRAKYDAIVGLENGQISLLKKKKFGLFDLENQVLIPTEYEKNIKKYNQDHYIAELEGEKVLIDINNKQVSEATFEEIKYWNDTSAFVKKDFLWKLLDIKNKVLLDLGIKSLQVIKKSNEEQVMIVLVENAYGVWSNVSGEIIAPTFNDIINVGTMENPVYFTEKHIEEASLYVVIYYDQNGKLIFKTAMEAEDYPMIYCDN